MNNQNPSTLDLLTDEDDGLRLSCWSMSSREMKEQFWGGRDKGCVVVLVGEIAGMVVGDKGERFSIGAGGMIPVKLGEFDLCFMLTLPGSWSGNRQVYFMSCTVLSCSTMALMVGLPDGSLCRHLWAMSAIVLAALAGNRPFSWGSMISDSLPSSARKGLLHLTKLHSSFGWRLSKFFLPVSNSRSTIPKLQTLLLGVSKPFSSVSSDRFAIAWINELG